MIYKRYNMSYYIGRGVVMVYGNLTGGGGDLLISLVGELCGNKSEIVLFISF